VTTFEHNCSLPPCVITQIHVPSIYPPSGEQWNWTHGILNFYIDGDTTPTITMTLLELAGESRFDTAGNNQPGNPGESDGGAWGIGMMGRTAKSGGVYSTVRIPFGKSIKTTIQSPPSSNGQSIYWMIIRGLENHAVIVGDLTLPPSARLKIYRVTPTELADFQLVTLANVTNEKSGALLRVNFDATGPNFGYLEACMRLVTDGATTPLFLSSGAEDYFLSASYFDEGMFKTPNSGLTYFKQGTLGAYKTHTIDPVVFRNGMQLIFRRCEKTQGCGSMAYCPNMYCPPGSDANPVYKPYDFDQQRLDESIATKTETQLGQSMAATSNTDVNYTEYFLGKAGASCNDVCKNESLLCNPLMDLGTNVTKMLVYLNISDCWKNGTGPNGETGMEWYAPDQPGYIIKGGDDQNFHECMGFIGYPSPYNCGATYPTNRRACHCTATLPPSPPPSPPPPPPPAQTVTYNTAVWLYEWDSTDVEEASQTQKQSASTKAVTVIAQLAQSNLITEVEEDVLVDRVMTNDAGLISLINGLSSPEHRARLVKHIRRQSTATTK